MNKDPLKIYQELQNIFEESEYLDFFGEELSQLDHALQCAHLAVEHKSPQHIVLACLFHDLGQLVAPDGTQAIGSLGYIGHEKIAADFLSKRGFKKDVTELIAGHISAKRYLVFKNADYNNKLSPASQKTLARQGGPMIAPEADKFTQDPLLEQKVQLRLWDEEAKIKGKKVPKFANYKEIILAYLRDKPASASVATKPTSAPIKPQNPTEANPVPPSWDAQVDLATDNFSNDPLSTYQPDYTPEEKEMFGKFRPTSSEDREAAAPKYQDFDDTRGPAIQDFQPAKKEHRPRPHHDKKNWESKKPFKKRS